jgi:hypothetical protein
VPYSAKGSPFTVAPGVPISIDAPVAGANSPAPSVLLLVNLSPYELQMSTPEQQVASLVDPYTRDGLQLDVSTDVLVVATPINVGLQVPALVTPQLFALWYLAYETAPSYPSSIALPNVSTPGIINGGDAQTLPVNGTLTIDLNDLPASFHSMWLYFAPAGSSQAGTISINTLVDVTDELIDSHNLKVLGNDSATVRLPLQPAAGTSMGIQVQIQPGAASGWTVTAVVDVDEAPPLPFQLWGNLYTSAGFLGPAPGGAPIPQAAEFHSNFDGANPCEILAAPTNGANYLFAVTASVATTPEQLQITGFSSGNQFGNIACTADTVYFPRDFTWPERVTEAIIISDTFNNQPISGTVHWSAGP